MTHLFAEPWVIITLIMAALLLFGAPKLPGMARSLGQSMRIFKSEVREFKQDSSVLKQEAAGIWQEASSLTGQTPAEAPAERSGSTTGTA